MSEPQSTEKTYVLVVDIKRTPLARTRPAAYGPFRTRDEAEYAAMDYYGTAITGASINEEFLIAELRSGSGMADRQHEAHVRAILATDA